MIELTTAPTLSHPASATELQPDCLLDPAPRRARTYPVHRGEFWTARQRQMHPVHYSVSYRASFKPELPDFFIRRYLGDQDQNGLVLDPFGGRGTTLLQANLNGYSGIHNDISPVSLFISSSRRHLPSLERIAARLKNFDLARRGLRWNSEEKDRFSPFFHEKTFSEIKALREIWLESDNDPELNYIMLTALSRLHGHSDGFFSVYSFPQISIMPEAQRRNNEKRGIVPAYRGIAERILRKSRRDLSQPIPAGFARAARENRYLKGDARGLTGVRTGSVDLIITSPPFLDKVDYAKDNWMRAWFIGAEDEVSRLPMAIFSNPHEWLSYMMEAIQEMGRVLRVGGRAVIEVGEVVHAGQTVFLEELMASFLPVTIDEGGGRRSLLRVEELFLHTQEFTKLANCWDVKNNEKGTNTNRCLVLRKEPLAGQARSARKVLPSTGRRKTLQLP